MENKEIILSDSFEIFLKYLYGRRNYHQSAGVKTIIEWRNLLMKIVNSIENKYQ